MGFRDLISGFISKGSEIKLVNRALDDIQIFFNLTYDFLVPVLGINEYEERILKFVQETRGLSDDEIKILRKRISPAIEGSTYIFMGEYDPHQPASSYIKDETYLKAFGEVIENIETFIHDESELPPESRFVDKSEALKAVEIVYNYIERFSQMREKYRKSPEELESSPRGITIGRRTLKKMADNERQVRKFLSDVLKELERFAREIDENY